MDKLVNKKFENMSNILVSIIVPVHNQENYIGRCLRSLLNQSLDQKKYEVIIINDGSTDKTKYALDLFKGDIINVIHINKNKGLPYALNLGIKNSKGKYIVRVDSDDYVNKDYLLFLSKFLEFNKKIDAIACDYLTVNSKEKTISIKNCEKEPIGCGIMFKKIHLEEIGGYDVKMKVWEDKDLIIRFKKKYKVSRLEIPLYRYRKHETNMTNSSSSTKKYLNKLNKKT